MNIFVIFWLLTNQTRTPPLFETSKSKTFFCPKTWTLYLSTPFEMIKSGWNSTKSFYFFNQKKLENFFFPNIWTPTLSTCLKWVKSWAQGTLTLFTSSNIVIICSISIVLHPYPHPFHPLEMATSGWNSKVIQFF